MKKRLRRLYFGRRVQYSVFESDLNGKELIELCGRIEREIEPSTDSCRLYRLCEGCATAVSILGRGDRYNAPDFIIV